MHGIRPSVTATPRHDASSTGERARPLPVAVVLDRMTHSGIARPLLATSISGYTMRHTLKAFFAHQSDAQHVVDELLASGYSNADTALSSDLPTGRADRYRFVGEDAKASGPVQRFAARLFGSGQHQHRKGYRDAIVQGRHVVTLAADSEPDVARAVAVIERFGPVGIEDHDDESDHGSVDADADAAGTRHSYPPGTEPGALQNRAHEDSRYFGTQSADSPPTGNTFEETMGADSQWVHPDDGRLHVLTPATISDSNSAVHDDEMAAYRYGKEMRISNMYRNRSWDEVEPSLKNGWEARSNSALTWDETKTTVRQGWNSTSPDIDDDHYYRTHWNAIYARSASDNDYDEHAPACLSGSEAQRSENYRSRDWRDSPSGVEDDWNARHAGQLSSWGNFKDAVTHGWNRIRLDTDSREPAGQSYGTRPGTNEGIGDDDRSTAGRDGSGPAHEATPTGGTGMTRMANPEVPGEPGHADSAAPTWNKVKTAVRHGWERVTS